MLALYAQLSAEAQGDTHGAQPVAHRVLQAAHRIRVGVDPVQEVDAERLVSIASAM